MWHCVVCHLLSLWSRVISKVSGLVIALRYGSLLQPDFHVAWSKILFSKLSRGKHYLVLRDQSSCWSDVGYSQSIDKGLKSPVGQKFVLRLWLPPTSVVISPIMSTLTAHSWWLDKTVRERTDHPISLAKRMKLQALQTHSCFRLSLTELLFFRLFLLFLLHLLFF